MIVLTNTKRTGDLDKPGSKYFRRVHDQKY